jgi:hypothetical protein
MKNLTKTTIALLISITAIILFPPSVIGQQLILEEKIAKEIIKYSSGMQAYDHIKYISQFYRFGANEGHQKAAEYVATKAKEYDLKEVTIEKFPYDGEKSYFAWKTFLPWFPYEAEVWMLEPEQKLLASYADIPLSLVAFSRYGDVTGELIFIENVNSPKSYEDKELKGKIILSIKPPKTQAIEVAVKQKGAIGFICYDTIPFFDFNRKPWDFPDQVGRSTLPNSNHSTFLFNLSYRNGLELTKMLQAGQKITLRLHVKAEMKAADIQVVSAILSGSELPKEEIIFIAHLDHYKPGCNDNASGSAAILEVAHTLQRMIKDSIIKPPKRSIRFIWTDELDGTIAWLAKHIDEDIKRIAVINMDMVGEKQFLTNSILNIHQTPHSLPSYLNDVVANILQVVLNYNELRYPPNDDYLIHSPGGSKRMLIARLAPYTFGSDHDVFIEQPIGIPAVMFSCWPDDFYHSSEDTLDKVDPTMLRRVIFMGAAIAATIAWIDGENALELAGIVAAGSQVRLAKDGERSFNMMNESSKNNLKKYYKEALNILKQAALREKKAISSVSVLSDDNELIQEFIETYRNKIDEEAIILQDGLSDYYHILCRHYQVNPALLPLTEKEKELSQLIPRRNPQYRGLMDENFYIENGGIVFLRWLIKQPEIARALSLTIEMLNFADGKRSLLEIRNAVSSEYEPIEVEMVESFFKHLEKAKVISFKKIH